MGTRSGSIDSSIIKYVMDNTGKSIEEITNDLNKCSGLLGICGKNDFRDVLKLKLDGDDKAILAYEMFKNSIVKFIGEYYFELDGRMDAIVFTAGVLENNSVIREDIINSLSNIMGIFLNKSVNDDIGANGNLDMGIISREDSKIPVYVIPTNEELMILRDTYRLVNGRE